jgi:3-oxoacyl-[acyl-carrier-protein] synthase II
VTPLVVTGLGVLSPFGIGQGRFASGIGSTAGPGRESACRVGPGHLAETFDLSKYPGARVAEVPSFDPTPYLGDKGLRSLDRLTKLLLVATRLALGDAGLKRDGAWVGGAPDRVGVVVSNAYGSLEAITELDRVALLEDARYINPSRFPLTVSNSAAGYASIWDDLRAVNVTVTDGNCGALDAVACAGALIEQGRADALLVGGAEAMSEALVLAFDRLGAFGDGACIGEGAAMLALESPWTARARGAAVVCTITGYGTAFEAPDRETALVHASPRALARAIAEALADAGIGAHEVDAVVSGISGLRAFDRAELAAIEAAFVNPCVVAPKLAIGETLGAGGAFGMSAAAALMTPAGGPGQGGRPAAHGSGAAPAEAAGGVAGGAGPGRCVVRGSLRTQPRTVLVTSLGYYGNASALVMCAGAR